MNARSRQHIWIYIAIPAVMLLYYNKAANWHYHMTEAGFLIEHAHPFTASNSGKPYQDHDHTDAELFFFAQIMQLTEFLFVALLILGLFLRSQQFSLGKYRPNYLAIPAKGPNPTRGPPTLYHS